MKTMKKTMKIVVSLVLAVMLLALMGCRNETETPKPEATQDAHASQKPTETEQPTQTEQSTHTGKPETTDIPTDIHDRNAIRTFLEIKDENGVRNGEKMNERYSPDDPNTWCYSPIDKEDRVWKDGYVGYIDLVEWRYDSVAGIRIEPFVQKRTSSDIGFVGELDLSNCKSLEYAIINGNNIKAINFEGCEALFEAYITDTESLETLNVKDTDIYRFYITNATSLKTFIPTPVECMVLRIREGGLKQLDWICTLAKKRIGKDYFHIKLSTEGAGSMETLCDDEDNYYLYLDAIPEEGHRFIGWYDANGKLISTDQLFAVINDDKLLGLGEDAQFEFVAKFE